MTTPQEKDIATLLAEKSSASRRIARFYSTFSCLMAVGCVSSLIGVVFWPSRNTGFGIATSVLCGTAMAMGWSAYVTMIQSSETFGFLSRCHQGDLTTEKKESDSLCQSSET